MKKKVIAIVGPTASGKTKLSIEIAKSIGAEIINGDSVQVYQGLDIGSAKISEVEKSGITHHLIDIRRPENTYSVYEFQKDARNLIHQIPIPMIVGGTGLYIKAALYNYEFIESKRNQSDETKYENISNEALYEMLLKLDPEIQIDFQNRRRVLRAIEQAQMGFKRSEKTKKDELLYSSLVIYLDLPKDVLEERLKLRLKKQLELGFIDEVKQLRNQNIFVNAIGYKEINCYLNEEITLEEAQSLIIQSSKRLAKKQKTYFKNQMNVIFLNALDHDLISKALTCIHDFLEDSN
jgi:tRNA dimethylallyltransferase